MSEPTVVNERHPLLAAGAGQNARTLPDEVVVPYCDTLSDRISYLSAAAQQEQQAGRLSLAAYQATRGFLHELRATLTVMALKHGRQLLDVEPLPLTIDPTESGMPTLKDFWQLHEDRDRAQAQLAQIPSREALITQATEAIYAGRRPMKEQILWIQRAYMERLAATPIVTEFRQLPPTLVGQKQRDRLNVISWTGIIRSVNLFECTTLHFIERGGWHIGGGNADIRSLIDDLAGGRHALPEVLGLLSETPGISPQTIERVTIGPYYHRWTENDELIAQAFAAAPNEEPWMLRATIERAATTRAAQRSVIEGKLDALWGRAPMESSPALRSKVLLVPLLVKQQLGNADEDGQPCAVYGVSGQGDLVG